MEYLNRGWMDHDAGSGRIRILGAVLGLIGGLLFGGIVLPSRLLTAPLTAIAAAGAAMFVENWLAAHPRTTFLPLRSAWVGGAAGLAAGLALGLVVGMGYSALAYVHGATLLVALQGLFTAIEVGAISAFAGLLTGFGLGASEARE